MIASVFVRSVLTGVLRKAGFSAWLFCLLNPAAQADYPSALSLNGFYTLDLSYSDSALPVIANGNVTHQLDQNKASLKNSLIGLQARYEFSPNLSAILQGSLYYNSQDHFDQSLDWAYLNFDAGNDYQLRAGRFLIPFLQGIELKSIGYSRLWARPLVPGSGAGGFINHTGIELIKRIGLDASNLTVQVALGQPEHDLTIIEGKSLQLASAQYETEQLRLRMAMLGTQYRAFRNNGALLNDNAQANMLSLEAEIRLEPWILALGYSNTDAEVTPDDTLSYVSLAYPLEELTPFLIARSNRQDFDTQPAPTTPPAMGPAAAANPPIPALVQQQQDSTRTGWGLGLRYDLGDSYALKTQWERIAIETAASRRTGNVYTLLLEGVF